jgi:hypothetical protein
MKLKLKHFRHPLKTANIAKARIAARWHAWKFADRGARHFASDPRYDLRSVVEGFASRINVDIDDDVSADAALLERICTSYNAAAKRQHFAPQTYRPTDWWEQQRKWSLPPVIQALATHDVTALGRMYRNFYRDPCSAGLIVPQDLSKNYFGGEVKDFHRRLYLIDVLYRIDYWQARMGSGFALSDLSGPLIGNPFGVVMEGTLVRVGAEYQHYCAHRIAGLLYSSSNVKQGVGQRGMVVEVGGGFGGMAYYLLRDRPGITYIDFDVPESIALTSYYLLKAFPQLRFLLCGEDELTKEAISRSDVVLMPVSELAAMPVGLADLTFSSHAISDLSEEAMVSYLRSIGNITRDYFLHIGKGQSGEEMSKLVERQVHSLKLAETRPSGWHDHRIKGVSEVECLYRVG